MSDLPRIHLTPAIALELWREAAKLEVGLRIPITPTDLEKIRPLMYTARKEANEPALESLQLIVAPRAEEIWLVKKTVEAP